MQREGKNRTRRQDCVVAQCRNVRAGAVKAVVV